MKRKIIAFIGAFILSINLLGQSSLTVYASDDLSGFNEWETSEKASYLFSHFVSTVSSALSFVISRGYNSQDILWSYLQACYDDLQVENCTYEEWLAYRLNVQQNTTTGEYELVLDDELVDLMKKACDKYISEECGWYECQTLDYRNYPATNFDSQGLYNTFISYCTQNIKGTDNTVFVGGFSSKSVDDGNGGTIALGFMYITESLENLEYYNYSGGNVAYITQDWSTFNPSLSILYDGGEIENGSFSVDRAWFRDDCSIWDLYRHTPITDGSKTVRIYKSLEDLKSYSVGQRPYYATSDFYNYDSSQDNSVTLTGSDLSNGSVYGDVYNYIINNYDNPDGLTEDELRDILDDYFNNSGGGSSSSGDDSGSGSSGNGLLDFLGGLSSIGDAILSILGKLMEYIGKALDLIGGTVTKVIDIIPKNITALLGALFPFFPEEWLTAIELGLVLAVIVGIVGLFKK